MQILWTHGRASVRLVQSILGQDRAYNTVQTMLNILLKKGKVRRFLKGRAYEYAPSISSERALADELRNIVDRMFRGSAEKLVVALLETQLISAERLQALGGESARLPDQRRAR